LIEHSTREAGVRSLERTPASLIRGVAVKVLGRAGPSGTEATGPLN